MFLKINLIFHWQAQATSIKIIKSFVKMSANVIDCHLANIRNNDISSNKYSKHNKASNSKAYFQKKMTEQK